MSDVPSTDPYKGVRDFYPEDWARLSMLFTRIRHTLALWGYEEYNASPLERAELYEAKTSEEIVNDQTYTFTDRGDRRVTLRPEMTPTLARMVAARRRELSFPLRWFSIPNVFRYERPQKGRLREHYQLNVDLIGVASPEADAECITLASRLLTSLGAQNEDFIIRINSREILNGACAAAGLTPDATRAYIRLLDKRVKMTPEAFATARETITHVDPLSFADATPLTTLISVLKQRGVTSVVYDPSITRGFDYYTGLVFEVFDTNPANPRSLFGGGRYDGLVALYGADTVPAIGFGMGDVTLLDFLETHNLLPHDTPAAPELYIGTPTPDSLACAQSFAEKLRAEDIRVFVNITDRSLGEQIKDAVRRAIPYFVAYGTDEETAGILRLKTLATSSEESLPAGELATRIRAQR